MSISSCSLVALKKGTQNHTEAEISAQTSSRTGRTSVSALKIFQSWAVCEQSSQPLTVVYTAQSAAIKYSAYG